MFIISLVILTIGVTGLAIVCSDLSSIKNNLALLFMSIIVGGSAFFGTQLPENDDEAYKKAIFNNPYEAKIEYQYNKDSVLVPSDTIYVLKKDSIK